MTVNRARFRLSLRLQVGITMLGNDQFSLRWWPRFPAEGLTAVERHEFERVKRFCLLAWRRNEQ